MLDPTKHIRQQVTRLSLFWHAAGNLIFTSADQMEVFPREVVAIILDACPWGAYNALGRVATWVRPDWTAHANRSVKIASVMVAGLDATISRLPSGQRYGISRTSRQATVGDPTDIAEMIIDHKLDGTIWYRELRRGVVVFLKTHGGTFDVYRQRVLSLPIIIEEYTASTYAYIYIHDDHIIAVDQDDVRTEISVPLSARVIGRTLSSLNVDELHEWYSRFRPHVQHLPIPRVEQSCCLFSQSIILAMLA